MKMRGKKKSPKGEKNPLDDFLLSWHLGYPVGYRYIITEVFGFEDKKF